MSWTISRREPLQLRANPEKPIVEVSGSLFGQECPDGRSRHHGAGLRERHNTHPDSPKTDWKVGDVRGIQEISVRQPIFANIFRSNILRFISRWLR